MKDEPKVESEGGGKKSQDTILAQFYTAEYNVIMGRVSLWANLQYAAWPILIGALTLVAHIDQIPVNLRWWVAVLVTLVVYLAYQGTMIDMLFYVLLIERELRPRAQALVGNNDFWIHERVRQKHFPANPAWSPKWPLIISLTIIVAAAAGLWYNTAVQERSEPRLRST